MMTMMMPSNQNEKPLKTNQNTLFMHWLVNKIYKSLCLDYFCDKQIILSVTLYSTVLAVPLLFEKQYYDSYNCHNRKR